MNELTCIIVDDEEMARKTLLHHCEKIENLQVVDVCENGVEAMKSLEESNVDLLFLDVEMPDLSGLELLDSLIKKPLVVLTTSKEEYAVKAFEYEVDDYLVKPIPFARMLQCMKKISNKIEEQKNQKGVMLEEEHFYVKIDSRLVKIDYEKLLLAKAKGDYVTLILKDANHVVHTTLRSIEQKLPPNIFLQVHRSYIINLREIVDIEDSSILIGEEIVPISRANRAELLNRLNTI